MTRDQSDPRSRRLGDGPIEAEMRAGMNRLAHALDTLLNDGKTSDEREWGFVLMTFRFGAEEGHRCNYISNADRADVVTLLKEQLARFEGQPEVSGRA